METCDYEMVGLPLMVVWKSASITLGAQCVMMVGMGMMLRWSADNSDFQLLVSY